MSIKNDTMSPDLFALKFVPMCYEELVFSYLAPQHKQIALE